jgi:RNA polymerase sigma factor (sigma-70 family)
VPTELTDEEGWIHYVVRKVFGLWGVDYEDACQEARIALIEAQRTYDPNQGSSYSSWAMLVVKGRVRDWMRRVDYLTVAQRRASREADPDDVRYQPPALLGDLTEYLSEYQDEGWTRASYVGTEREHLAAFVRWYRNTDPGDNRLVVLAMYLDDFTFLEISWVLGLSEARVCQLWKQIEQAAVRYGAEHHARRGSFGRLAPTRHDGPEEDVHAA